MGQELAQQSRTGIADQSGFQVSFFNFLILKETEGLATGLTLFKLSQVDGLKLTEGGLLQVQSVLVSSWMDSVQKAQDPDFLIRAIPANLWMPDILRMGVVKKCMMINDMI